jgi:hypothetical protein
MALSDISLTVTICNKCGTILIATKDKRMNFTDNEKQIIYKITERIKEIKICHAEDEVNKNFSLIVIIIPIRIFTIAP